MQTLAFFLFIFVIVLRTANISFTLFKKVTISLIFISITVFAFASIGGGKNKTRPLSLKPGSIPMKSAKGFTLKTGLNYRGSIILKESRSANYISYKSLITYQKGNTTYILPNHYKVSIQPNTSKSHLQMLNFRIKLCK